MELLKFMGEVLGDKDIYIEKRDDTELPKEHLRNSPEKLKDRFRDFIEKILHMKALELLKDKGGILLIDGALTVTYDTPTSFINNFIEESENNGVSIFALSKRSKLLIGNKYIYQVFNDDPNFVGYMELLNYFKTQRNSKRRKEVTKAKGLYAVKFSPSSPTFRADVNPRKGNLPEEVIEAVYNLINFRYGYPVPLIEAHWFSCFTKTDILNILSELGIKRKIKIETEKSLEVAFSPFGGKYK